VAKSPIDDLGREMKVAIPKFDFFERVRVQTTDPAKAHLNGEMGMVLGRTQTENHPEPFLYAVTIDSCKDGWSLFENELEATGQWAQRQDYETGRRIRVHVDENGRGSIVPPEDDVT